MALDSCFRNSKLPNALSGAVGQQRMLYGTELSLGQSLKPDGFILCLEVKGSAAGRPLADSIRSFTSEQSVAGWLHPDQQTWKVCLQPFTSPGTTRTPVQTAPWPLVPPSLLGFVTQCQANGQCSHAGYYIVICLILGGVVREKGTEVKAVTIER